MSAAGRVLKIVAVGDGFVGKTSLLITHTAGAYSEEYVPTVFENYAGNLTVDGVEYNYTLMDTAGQEEFDRVRILCYNGASAFIVCFAVNSPTSLANVKTQWLPEIRKECGETVPVVLVGTKSDLRSTSTDTMVKRAEARKVARACKMYNYVECSAKAMTGCTEVFEEAVRSVVNPQDHWKQCPLL
ncbi:ras-like GTP-binding protein RhoL [Eriocheir sinensis]|uniref:ras-like GTP-binding protein RhoL n=1 Tax=Eriocheir sinensis TaxID=95602 RepID=UPI0021C82352|nr:ras-like GTP-binding protein RhoL [Eriocheir sinensis]XP_050726321.1 ras-like GTP-binding protein RhoL [Eriocheir sinensis]XP_050726322.1 ras-like GTP-binding protein RhoL [Eriocheir sinensis]XP_050726323.1 ras-like GTP-binding protein RhoL [Eriocheir sinensis]XP_050726324.1 ras-like GTP-binding protein RhoL [Eriocheir sinensis]XP_050726325.1 ras-like GTP-binding protein RhoL [Eriocheir sinensis]XP_050726326.1 ras-like GTP-binding protein RhoL [Eriocheir sinensis]XP_050726327.1 ras-like G